MDGVKLRPMRDGDVRLLADAWLECYSHSAFAKFAGYTYRAGHESLIKKLLAQAFVLIACADDPSGEPIFGFACTDARVKPPAIHFVYVKSKFRRRGIATLLIGGMRDVDAVYTHHPPAEMLEKIPKRWDFDPYPAML